MCCGSRASGNGVFSAFELGISRKILHDWIKAWKVHQPEGLNCKRGPKPGPRKLKPLATYDDRRSAPDADRTDVAYRPRRVRISSQGQGFKFTVCVLNKNEPTSTRLIFTISQVDVPI